MQPFLQFVQTKANSTLQLVCLVEVEVLDRPLSALQGCLVGLGLKAEYGQLLRDGFVQVGACMLPVLHADALPSSGAPAHLHEATSEAQLRVMNFDDLVHPNSADELAAVSCECIPWRV